MIRKILLVILILFIAIQFYPRPGKNISTTVSATDIGGQVNVPAGVDSILTKSCKDCHSNNTVYPWYASVQPVAWWLGEHIKEGKKELNLSEFGTYSARKQFHKLEEIAEMVEDGEMPLRSYTLVHTTSKLSAAEKSLVIEWSKAARAGMSAKYPADSLQRKK